MNLSEFLNQLTYHVISSKLVIISVYNATFLFPVRLDSFEITGSLTPYHNLTGFITLPCALNRSLLLNLAINILIAVIKAFTIFDPRCLEGTIKTIQWTLRQRT